MTLWTHAFVIITFVEAMGGGGDIEAKEKGPKTMSLSASGYFEPCMIICDNKL